MATPAWTDPNDRDPGITLLSLFVYLAVALVFAAAVIVYVARCRRRRRSEP